MSQIEQIKGINKQIQKDYGFEPEFETGKQLLEENDSAGNTFKATAKRVLIGTAVIRATTMIFSIILLLNLQLNLLDPMVLFGLMLGGAVIYWFSGASMQAVSTGAYRAVNYIKEHIHLDTNKAASIEDSKSVVKICTIYAQKGMLNIFIVIFSFTIAFACFDANLFASYLISIAIFGLYQALYMANAGGAWDNAKKVVEVDLHEKVRLCMTLPLSVTLSVIRIKILHPWRLTRLSSSQPSSVCLPLRWLLPLPAVFPSGWVLCSSLSV